MIPGEPRAKITKDNPRDPDSIFYWFEDNEGANAYARHCGSVGRDVDRPDGGTVVMTYDETRLRSNSLGVMAVFRDSAGQSRELDRSSRYL